jgi:hypothetical protein
MLTTNKLKNYLKILIESIDPEDLSALEQKYEQDITQKNIHATINARNEKYSLQGWNFLNTTIEHLNEIDDPKIHPQINSNPEYKYEKIKEIITDELHFKKIGDGVYRDVYSRPDINFVIKIEQFELSQDTNTMISDGANENEYNTYFNYGKNSRPRNELFTKIYAYDHKDKMWIISEKVNTFSTNNMDILLEIFKPFTQLFSNMIDFIESEKSFRNFPDSPLYNKNYRQGERLLFKKNYIVHGIFNNKVDDAEYLFQFIFTFMHKLCERLELINDLIIAFKYAIIDFILIHFYISGAYYDYDELKNRKPIILRLFMKKFNEQFPNLKPTPDIAYFTNFIKNRYIEDMHFYNVGYRDMTNNPNEPWKNLVILDFGEYGT